MDPTNIKDLPTPALLLNKAVLERNCNQMQQRISSNGISLRPHMKTAKSYDVYKLATESGFKGITVSTLAEAQYFSSKGVTDILYAVGIVPAKIKQVAEIQSKGCDLKLIIDNLSIVPLLNNTAKDLGITLKLLIEIDSGGRRGGVMADSTDLIEIAREIRSGSNIKYLGVMTHAGHSYHCKSVDEIISIAEAERVSVVTAAERLERELSMNSQIISTGSTPTAKYAQSFNGLTEARPGVYMFGDIDQYFIGSCEIGDIAVSILTTVIGHNKQANRILIDAGGLALSKDISASEFSKLTGYGFICDEFSRLIDGLYVESVHQEHGLIATSSSNSLLDFDAHPVGSLLRILPIHACMSVAAYEHYVVHDSENNFIEVWPRVNRWYSA